MGKRKLSDVDGFRTERREVQKYYCTEGDFVYHVANDDARQDDDQDTWMGLSPEEEFQRKLEMQRIDEMHRRIMLRIQEERNRNLMLQHSMSINRSSFQQSAGNSSPLSDHGFGSQ